MSDESQRWGLNAIGVDEPFYLDLDERLDEKGWHLQLQCKGTTLVVDLNSPKDITTILAFMTENYGKTKWRAAKSIPVFRQEQSFTQKLRR
jgi:hypothetical protein